MRKEQGQRGEVIQETIVELYGHQSVEDGSYYYYYYYLQNWRRDDDVLPTDQLQGCVDNILYYA